MDRIIYRNAISAGGCLLSLLRTSLYFMVVLAGRVCFLTLDPQTIVQGASNEMLSQIVA